MKKILLVFSAIAVALVSSCSYDDKPLTDRVDALDSRLTKLETAVQKINEGIGDIKSVVEALENGDKIVSVTPVEGGFEVVYSKAGKFTIKNGADGKDGQDGVTPVIDTRKDADGIYYWTVNGEFLLDKDGQKLPVTSHITPKVRLNNDNFEISYDNEATWEILGPAGSIPPGAIVINEVKEAADAVTFVLSNGQSISIPKAVEFAMEVNKYAGAVKPGSKSTTISVRITGADKETIIDAIATGGFEVTKVQINVVGDIPYGADLTISVPDPLPANGKIFIFASNSKGVTVSKVLKFENGEFMLDAVGEQGAMPEGGVLNIPAGGDNVWFTITTTYGYEISIPEDAKSWITDITDQMMMMMTKAARTDYVVLKVAPNTTGKERRTFVNFLLGIQTLDSIEIVQAAN